MPMRVASGVRLTSLAALTMLLAAEADGQGTRCTRADGRGAMFLTASYYTTQSGFDARGNRTRFGDEGRFTKLQVNPYTEYGLTDDLTFVASIALVRLQSSSRSYNVSNVGVANPELSLAFSVADMPGLARLFCAFYATVKLPYHTGGEPQIGFRQTDFEAKVRSLGYLHINRKPGWWVVDAGYRVRTEEPADEIRLDLTGGYRFSRHWFVLAQLITTTSLGNGLPIPYGGNPSLDPNYASYALQSSLVYRFGRTQRVQFGVAEELAGRNAGNGATLLGVYWLDF